MPDYGFSISSASSIHESKSTFKPAVYRGSPHRTEKWEAENTVLCETVLFLIEYRDIAKTVLCETLLHNNPYYARN